jgi:hypothetical protein
VDVSQHFGSSTVMELPSFVNCDRLFCTETGGSRTEEVERVISSFFDIEFYDPQINVGITDEKMSASPARNCFLRSEK